MNDATLGIVHYCEVHGPRAIFATRASTTLPPERPLISSSAHCHLCQTLCPSDGLLISLERPLHFLSYSPSPDERLLRHVAVRATSIEGFRDVLQGTCPLDKGGPLLVADQRHLGGRSLFAFTFILRDSSSRGHKRIYSLFLLLRDHFWLLQCHDYIHSFFKRLATKFQSRANSLYDPEEDSPKKRSLSKLLGDEELYVRLHRVFVGVLKAIGRNFVDIVHFDDGRTPKEALEYTSKDASFREIFNLSEIGVQRLIVYGTLLNKRIIITSDDGRYSMGLLSPLSPHGKDIYRDQSADMVLLVRHRQLTVIQCPWSVPSPVPALVNRGVQILKKSVLSDALLIKKLETLREEILGLSKVLSFTYGGEDRKVKALLKSMNLAPTDKDILKVWHTSAVG